MTNQAQNFWFKAKRYGYGWTWPVNWQGWLTFAVFILVFLISLMLLEMPYLSDDRPVPRNKFILHILITVLDVLALFLVGKRYGGPARWRWGGKGKDAAD